MPRPYEKGSLLATGTQIEVVMPQMGVSVSEGTITKWVKQPGDAIANTATTSMNTTTSTTPSSTTYSG